ncbi:MAG: hypothetical protein GC193_10230 [Cryomorphaceae bacterium]|nr:hypothetical protein [Cryomorphaceae bacterium]
MRNLFILLFVVVISLGAKAQASLPEGDLQVNAGLGITNLAFPLSIGVDYGLMPDITVGGEMNFWSYKNRVIFSDYRFTVIGFSVNGNYHLNTLADLPSNVDAYAGLNLGFYVLSSSFAGANDSNLGIGGQFGGRYFFSDKAAFLLEVGGGTYFSTAKVGITFLL